MPQRDLQGRAAWSAAKNPGFSLQGPTYPQGMHTRRAQAIGGPHGENLDHIESPAKTYQVRFRRGVFLLGLLPPGLHTRRAYSSITRRGSPLKYFAA